MGGLAYVDPGAGLLFVAVGFALLILCLVVIIVFVRGARRRRRRQQQGLCRRCGFNLTGNTSGRCPECGATSGSSFAGGQIAPP